MLGFPSSQLTTEFPTQTPPEQLSTVEQALPSLQLFVLSGVKTQPNEGLQVSSVH